MRKRIISIALLLVLAACSSGGAGGSSSGGTSNTNTDNGGGTTISWTSVETVTLIGSVDVAGAPSLTNGTVVAVPASGHSAQSSISADGAFSVDLLSESGPYLIGLYDASSQLVALVEFNGGVQLPLDEVRQVSSQGLAAQAASPYVIDLGRITVNAAAGRAYPQHDPVRDNLVRGDTNTTLQVDVDADTVPDVAEAVNTGGVSMTNGAPTDPRDVTPPSAPTNFSTDAISASQVALMWDASTDATGVAGYKIYRNRTMIRQVSVTTATDSGLDASTQYCYQVAAFDAAGNLSALSQQSCATTISIGSPITAADYAGLWQSSTTLNYSDGRVGSFTSYNYSVASGQGINGVRSKEEMSQLSYFTGTLSNNTMYLNFEVWYPALNCATWDVHGTSTLSPDKSSSTASGSFLGCDGSSGTYTVASQKVSNTLPTATDFAGNWSGQSIWSPGVAAWSVFTASGTSLNGTITVGADDYAMTGIVQNGVINFTLGPPSSNPTCAFWEAQGIGVVSPDHNHMILNGKGKFNCNNTVGSFTLNLTKGQTSSQDTIVGAWDIDNGSATKPFAAVFYNNGRYFLYDDNGYQYGTYSWDASTEHVSVSVISTSYAEPAITPGVFHRVVVSGNTMTFPPDPSDPNDSGLTLRRVASSTSAIVGAWDNITHDDDDTTESSANAPFALVLYDNGHYFIYTMGSSDWANNGCVQGYEYGTYTWNPATGAFMPNIISENDGTCGMSDNNGQTIYIRVSGGNMEVLPTELDAGAAATRVE